MYDRTELQSYYWNTNSIIIVLISLMRGDVTWNSETCEFR